MVRLKVLLIEDEVAIRRFLKAGLDEAEYDLIESETGQDGISKAATMSPDLILLDLGLPDMDGLQVTTKLREWSQIPIIILSARGQEHDKISALDSGADDYLTKPFGIGELLARMRAAVRAHQRSAGAKTEPVMETGELKIDFSSRQVYRCGMEVRLTPLEYKLLAALARNAGKVITHKQLLVEVWGQAYARENHYLRVFMKQLRHKLEVEPARPRHLTTDQGVGYRFRAE